MRETELIKYAKESWQFKQQLRGGAGDNVGNDTEQASGSTSRAQSSTEPKDDTDQTEDVDTSGQVCPLVDAQANNPEITTKEESPSDSDESLEALNSFFAAASAADDAHVSDTVPAEPEHVDDHSEQTDENTMFIEIGRRTIATSTCPHMDVTDLIARIAIDLRITTRQTALIKAGEMLVFTSQLPCRGLCGWPSWRATKLPVAHGAQKQVGQEVGIPDDVWDHRCQQCKGHEGDGERADEFGDLSTEQELAKMQEEDHNVVVIQMERARDTIYWQVHKSMKVKQMLDQYAAIKRIKRSPLSLFAEMDPEATFEDDMHLSLVNRPSKKLRGGDRPWLRHDCNLFLAHDFIEHQSYYMDAMEDYPARLQEAEQAWGTYWYKGLQLATGVPLSKLRSRTLQRTNSCSYAMPWLRHPKEIQYSAFISLGEVCEWCGPAQEDESTPECWRAWMNDILNRTLWVELLHSHTMRAGAKGRLAWESTSSQTGITLITEVRGDGAKLPVLPLDKVCNGAFGVCCCLMSSFSRIAAVKSDKPLILCFPGKVTSPLKKLGLADKQIIESEAFVKEPEAGEVLRRNVSYLMLSESTFSFGENVTKAASKHRIIH